MRVSVVIDIGNTSVKVGHFRDGVLYEALNLTNIEDASNYVDTIKPVSVLIATVGETPTLLKEATNAYSVTFLSGETRLPIKNHYKTTNTLGVDRIAAVVGATVVSPGMNNLVIDMGTCITYDYIDEDGNYFGGAISPGVNMRYKAMHELTANLPLIASHEGAPLIGNSTATSMKSGVINGVIAELEGIIERYREKNKDINVIMCGGDANSFESKIKARIFASPKLVLIGLNRILEYNENN